MRRILVIFLSLILTIGISVKIGESIEEKILDSERAAQVFAGLEVQYYEGGFYFYRTAKEENRWVNATFKMSPETQITYLVIDGTIIVDVTTGDEPLNGIPQNVVGETRYFNLWLNGYENGSPVVHGNFYTELLLPGDPIVVELQPYNIYYFLEFEVPYGVEPENLRLVIEGSNWQYNESMKGFQVWVNPLVISEYEIVDISSGIIYEIGEINPLEGELKDKDSIINLLLPKGIKKIDFRETNYIWLENQFLDGQVIREGEIVPAQVYFMNLEGKGGSINVYGLTSHGELPMIEVRRWTERGEMPIINSSNNYLTIPSGYHKIVVTITGEMINTSFQIHFSRW
jgi:hypothetical protein